MIKCIGVKESLLFKDLVDQSDEAVLADSPYYSEEHETYLFECDAQEFLMRKAYRDNPLSKADEIFNKGVSRIRVRVAHVFGRMKQLGMDYVRSIRLKQASQHNSLCNLAYNMDLYAFLKR